MNRIILPVLAGVLLAATSPALAAEPKVPTQRFYGKITAVDAQRGTLAVHNRKQKSDATFRIDERTVTVFDKQQVPLSHLKVGQNLIITYTQEATGNHARRVTIRKPPAPRKK